ncbi:hypothetical protein L2E82_12158 [Cichorium intybus]|uniref:Uncharacterized protein n=1 Tax=Cichorium intybus TaxID=13427 RepID=A0ACB9GGC5_CICIN|nr:hypothetical protein L2E82_12158 [Cichorium intybus]
MAFPGHLRMPVQELFGAIMIFDNKYIVHVLSIPLEAMACNVMLDLLLSNSTSLAIKQTALHSSLSSIFYP